MRSEKEKLIQREREIYNAGKRKIYIYTYIGGEREKEHKWWKGLA